MEVALLLALFLLLGTTRAQDDDDDDNKGEFVDEEYKDEYIVWFGIVY